MSKFVFLILAAGLQLCAFTNAGFSSCTYKDLADLVAYLQSDRPGIVELVKRERVAFHTKLVHLVSTLHTKLTEHQAGKDDPSNDVQVRDELMTVSEALKKLDDDDLKIIDYGTNLSTRLKSLAASYKNSQQ